MGLFFIQAPQEWVKANTKAFLYKEGRYRSQILFWFLHQMLFFRVIFSLAHMIIYFHNVVSIFYMHFKITSYFWLLLYPCICMYSAVFKFKCASVFVYVRSKGIVYMLAVRAFNQFTPLAHVSVTPAPGWQEVVRAMENSSYFESLEAKAKERYREKLSCVGSSIQDDPYLWKKGCKIRQ